MLERQSTAGKAWPLVEAANMFWEGYVIFLTRYANSDCDFILFILF